MDATTWLVDATTWLVVAFTYYMTATGYYMTAFRGGGGWRAGPEARGRAR
jgi:hypothetical protein